MKRQGRVNPRQKECKVHVARTKTHEGGWQEQMGHGSYEMLRRSPQVTRILRVFSWGVMRDLISSCSAQFMQGMRDRSHSKSHPSSMGAKGEAEEVMPAEAEVREKGVFWED